MFNIGFLGLGRLGLPIAAVLSQTHNVIGYDPAPSTHERLHDGHPWENDLTSYLGKITLQRTVPKNVDVYVVCVQTPHDERLDGTHPDDGRRAPFDLSYVRNALRLIGHDSPPVVLMSTVMPGDTRRLAAEVDSLTYSPAFPAMGTTIRDILDPEFILVGGDPAPVHQLWDPIVSVPYHVTNYETAELAKLAYNTAVGLKIALANTVGWISEQVGADGGQVMDVLSQAKRRIVSPAYLQPGLGDGGACHPRDQIAMSYLARQVGVYDLFADLIAHREAHSLWVADLAKESGLPVVILGAGYKANSPLTDGSPARLLANQTGWPIIGSDSDVTEPSCVVVGVAHDFYAYLELPEGSLVVDMFGHVTSNVDVVTPGRLPAD